MKIDPSLLCLSLTFHWFDQTLTGGKRIEYREKTPRWMTQIFDIREQLKHVRFSRGYTKITLTYAITKIDIGPCPIPGWDGDYIRIHFE